MPLPEINRIKQVVCCKRPIRDKPQKITVKVDEKPRTLETSGWACGNCGLVKHTIRIGTKPTENAELNHILKKYLETHLNTVKPAWATSDRLSDITHLFHEEARNMIEHAAPNTKATFWVGVTPSGLLLRFRNERKTPIDPKELIARDEKKPETEDAMLNDEQINDWLAALEDKHGALAWQEIGGMGRDYRLLADRHHFRTEKTGHIVNQYYAWEFKQ